MEKCGDEQKLFSFNENGDLNSVEIVFSFTVQPQSISNDETAVPYEYSRDKDGFFRITLESPSIGFGTKAYRTLFLKRWYTTVVVRKRNVKTYLPNRLSL